MKRRNFSAMFYSQANLSYQRTWWKLQEVYHFFLGLF